MDVNFLVPHQIRYSGKKKGELEATLERLLTYVEQCDSHLPRLTVRETLEFAMDTQISNVRSENSRFHTTIHSTSELNCS